jgi:hypothetical protein
MSLISNYVNWNTYLINLKLYKGLKIQTIIWQCYMYSNFHYKSLGGHHDEKEKLKNK